MTNALSTLSVLPSEKLEVAQFARMLKSEILVNDRDPLVILKQLNLIMKTLEDVLKDPDIEKHFLVEAEKYIEKSFDHAGIRFVVKEVGTKYNYNDSGDVVWFDLQKEKEILDKKIKDRETFLKAVPYEGVANTEHGNFITKPTKTSKTKVTVVV